MKSIKQQMIELVNDKDFRNFIEFVENRFKYLEENGVKRSELYQDEILGTASDKYPQFKGREHLAGDANVFRLSGCLDYSDERIDQMVRAMGDSRTMEVRSFVFAMTCYSEFLDVREKYQFSNEVFDEFKIRFAKTIDDNDYFSIAKPLLTVQVELVMSTIKDFTPMIDLACLSSRLQGKPVSPRKVVLSIIDNIRAMEISDPTFDVSKAIDLCRDVTIAVAEGQLYRAEA